MTRTLDSYEPWQVRSRCFVQIDLADAYLIDGEHDHAAALTRDALSTAGGVSSSRTVSRIQALQHQIRPLHSAGLAELDDDITGFLRRAHDDESITRVRRPGGGGLAGHGGGGGNSGVAGTGSVTVSRPFLAPAGRELLVDAQIETGLDEELWMVVPSQQGVLLTPTSKRFTKAVHYPDFDGPAERIIADSATPDVWLDPSRREGPSFLLAGQAGAGEILELWD